MQVVSNSDGIGEYSVTPIDLDLLMQVFSVQERNGVSYRLGGKAASLDMDSHDIESIDCSGEVRYLIAKATHGALIIPDGSQNQRAWAEANLTHQVRYRNLPMAGEGRLFLCFIRPGHNGCGPIGHVWLVTLLDGNPTPRTMESHGGTGVDSRAWNSHTLWREVYSAWELPTLTHPNPA